MEKKNKFKESVDAVRERASDGDWCEDMQKKFGFEWQGPEMFAEDGGTVTSAFASYTSRVPLPLPTSGTSMATPTVPIIVPGVDDEVPNEDLRLQLASMLGGAQQSQCTSLKGYRWRGELFEEGDDQW